MNGATLNETRAVKLDGTGAGVASAGPLSAREVWHPGAVHVSVATAVNEATCVIYVGDAPQDRCKRDTTFTGSSGDTTDTGVNTATVKNPDRVWAVWTGGDPGAQATMTVTGTRDV